MVEHYEGWGGVLGKGGCVCYSDVAICSNFFNCNNSVEQYQIDSFKASQTKSSRMHFCFCITSTRVSLLTMDNLPTVVGDRNQRGDKSNNLHQISNSFPEEIICLKQKQTQVTKSQIMDEDNGSPAYSHQSKSHHGGVLTVMIMVGICHRRIPTIEYNDDDDNDNEKKQNN